MVLLQKTDTLNKMNADLDRVSDRVAMSARVRYPEISALLDQIVQAGGKRLRPMLLLLAAKPYQFDESLETLVTAAAGVELLHTASLVHDDTVDRSAIRRGQPTLNSVLTSGSVILIGDYLFAQSAMLAAATSNTRVVAVFASTLADICDGQLMEMIEATNLDQTRADYLQRIYGKTASLFAGSAEMGSVLAGAPEAEIQEFRAFGTDVGLAFQIVDDVLDITGETADLGKPAGNDLRQGTLTLPVIDYLGHLEAGDPDRRAIADIVAGTADDATIERILEQIRASGSVERSLAEAEALVDGAKKRIALITDGETRDLLHEFADLAVYRAA